MTFSPDFFTQIINSYLPEPHASLLNGIIFGVPLHGNKVLYKQLQVVGLLHIVVLSGMNITIIAATVSHVLSGLSKRVSIVITILIIIIFIAFVKPQAPIIRAGFTGVLTLVSNITGRKTIALYLLFVSALFTALVWPQWINTVSFQLSYAATLGLILFSKKNTVQKEAKNAVGEVINYVKDEFATSMAAQVFTVPVIFIYFRQVSLIAPVANILIAWTITPIMIIGFITAFLGSFNYYLGLVPAYICYGLISYLVLVIEFLSKIPYVFIQF